MNKGRKQWENVITPDSSYLFFQLKALWEYRDLLRMFVRRDFVALYKQTILGPLWFFLQPLITSVAFYFVFNKVAGIDTNGVPPILFYLSGIALWNFFSESFSKIATTFKDNQNIFGKVYFPRLIVPLSNVISAFFKFLIQFFMFFCFYFYFSFDQSHSFQPNLSLLLIPFYLLITGCFALGTGLMICALTLKYRDLMFILTYGIQLLMFATPVVYPLSEVEKGKGILLLNPMTSILEAFRFSILGVGDFNILYLIISAVVVFLVLVMGVWVFNKTEKSFVDLV